MRAAVPVSGLAAREARVLGPAGELLLGEPLCCGVPGAAAGEPRPVMGDPTVLNGRLVPGKADF